MGSTKWEEIGMPQTKLQGEELGTVPAGGIIMWAGTIANIPTGWLICDGNNGTPNLLS